MKSSIDTQVSRYLIYLFLNAYQLFSLEDQQVLGSCIHNCQGFRDKLFFVYLRPYRIVIAVYFFVFFHHKDCVCPFY